MTAHTQPVRLVPILVGLVILFSCAEPPDSDDVLGPSLGKAPATGLTVKSVDPDSVPQDTTLDVRVFGSGFDTSAEAEFLLDGQPDPRIRTNSTRFVRSTEVVANVTIAIDAVPTLYDAQVTLRSNGKKGIGTEKLTVLAFVDLGTFGGSRSSGWGVNDEGSVTGRSDTTGNLGRVFVWDARTSTMRNLGWLEAGAINNARTVVGLNAEGHPTRWLYDEGSDHWTAEELVQPHNPDAGAGDINQLGQIVGAADSVVPGVGGGAVLWQSPSELVPLDPTGRFTRSGAAAINAGGQVVGMGRRGAGGDTAWVWVPDVPNGSTGRIVVLPSFNGLPFHRAEGINDAGDVVGWAQTTRGAQYALLWRRNPGQPDPAGPGAYLAPIDLGASLGRNGKAYDVNNALKVVGHLRTDAFAWDPVNGVRLLPGPPGGSESAVSVNESVPATAAGTATVNGNPRAIRWVLP
jgi:probable HAF family extracellular repeat protein